MFLGTDGTQEAKAAVQDQAFVERYTGMCVENTVDAG
jgi:hypothetical protein